MCNRDQKLNKSLQQLLATNTTDQKKKKQKRTLHQDNRHRPNSVSTEATARAYVLFCETHSPRLMFISPWHAGLFSKTKLSEDILHQQTRMMDLATGRHHFSPNLNASQNTVSEVSFGDPETRVR